MTDSQNWNEPLTDEERGRAETSSAAEEGRWTSEDAARMWAEARTDRGKLAVAYMATRGLDITRVSPDELRTDNHRSKPGAKPFPALLFPGTNEAGEVTRVSAVRFKLVADVVKSHLNRSLRLCGILVCDTFVDRGNSFFEQFKAGSEWLDVIILNRTVCHERNGQVFGFGAQIGNQIPGGEAVFNRLMCGRNEIHRVLQFANEHIHQQDLQNEKRDRNGHSEQQLVPNPHEINLL